MILAKRARLIMRDGREIIYTHILSFIADYNELWIKGETFDIDQGICRNVIHDFKCKDILNLDVEFYKEVGRDERDNHSSSPKD